MTVHCVLSWIILNLAFSQKVQSNTKLNDNQKTPYLFQGVCVCAIQPGWELQEEVKTSDITQKKSTHEFLLTVLTSPPSEKLTGKVPHEQPWRAVAQVNCGVEKLVVASSLPQAEEAHAPTCPAYTLVTCQSYTSGLQKPGSRIDDLNPRSHQKARKC